MEEKPIDLTDALSGESVLLFDQCRNDAVFATQCAYDRRDGIMIGKISTFLQRMVLLEELADEYKKLLDRDSDRDYRRRGAVGGDEGVGLMLGLGRNGVYARLEALGLHIQNLRDGNPIPIPFEKSRLHEDQEKIRRYAHTSSEEKAHSCYNQPPDVHITEHREQLQKCLYPASLIGMNEAATILGLSKIRVKQLAQQGRIGQLVGGRYIFLREELENFAKIKRPPGPRPRL